MSSTIGIKIANGEFYSIIEENSSVKKRLILTTVHDKQRSVQIDLYKSDTRTMADAMYIGSLVVENIKPRVKGEPSIELVINSTDDGTINADAWDMDPTAKREHQYLNVSLKSIEEDNREYDIPDFELEESERPPIGLIGKAESALKTSQKEKNGNNMLPIVIIAALFLIVVCLGLWLFLIRGKTTGGTAAAAQSSAASGYSSQQTQTPGQSSQNSTSQTQQTSQANQSAQTAQGTGAQQTAQSGAQSSAQPAQTAQGTSAQQAAQTAVPPPEQTPEPTPAPAAQTTPAQTQPAAPVQTQTAPAQSQPATPVQPAAAPVVIVAPAAAPAPVQTQRTRPVPPVSSYRVPATIPREGVRYTIRWGDTLWDIAEAFYRNPWLYPRIARFNNIRNPDLIISGTTIRVPPRN